MKVNPKDTLLSASSSDYFLKFCPYFQDERATEFPQLFHVEHGESEWRGRFFENRAKKQGARMALNGFLFEKKVRIAKAKAMQRKACF